MQGASTNYFWIVNWVVLLFLSLLPTSCTKLAKPEPDYYFITPSITYLRECPRYDCPVVAEAYNSDKVKILEKGEEGWLRVQILDSQKIGWTQSSLLSDLPVAEKKYFVMVDQLPLRNFPNEEVLSRKLLAKGEQVHKIHDNEQGWWRVLVPKDKTLGWVPSAAVSEKQPDLPQRKEEPQEIAAPAKTRQTPSPPPAPSQTFYYVAAESLDLHITPLRSSQVVKVLKLNDKVEKISQSGPSWLKVRYPDTNAEGWALSRYLKDAPVQKGQEVTRKKKSPPRAIPRTRAAEDQAEPEALEPEGM